jgi:hypothetical protein
MSAQLTERNRQSRDNPILNAEYSPVLALWLVRLSSCRSPGYGGPEGSHACASCPASTSRKKTRAVPRGRPGSSPPAPATHSAGADHPACRNPQAEHRCPGNWTLWLCRRTGCYRRPARRPRSRADPRRPPRRRAAEGAQHGGLASAIRRPAGPGPPPAAPVTSTSPLTRALLSVPRRLARQHYNQ